MGQMGWRDGARCRRQEMGLGVDVTHDVPVVAIAHLLCGELVCVFVSACVRACVCVWQGAVLTRGRHALTSSRHRPNKAAVKRPSTASAKTLL